jgi:hypothetical protein
VSAPGLASYKASGYATIGDIALFFVYIVQLQGHIQSAANEMNKASIVLAVAPGYPQ